MELPWSFPATHKLGLCDFSSYALRLFTMLTIQWLGLTIQLTAACFSTSLMLHMPPTGQTHMNPTLKDPGVPWSHLIMLLSNTKKALLLLPLLWLWHEIEAFYNGLYYRHCRQTVISTIWFSFVHTHTLFRSTNNTTTICVYLQLLCEKEN